MRKKSPIALTSYEDLFRDEKRETVEQLPLDQLEEFPNHPYSVPDNEELAMLRDSIIAMNKPITVYLCKRCVLRFGVDKVRIIL